MTKIEFERWLSKVTKELAIHGLKLEYEYNSDTKLPRYEVAIFSSNGNRINDATWFTHNMLNDASYITRATNSFVDRTLKQFYEGHTTEPV